MLGFGDKKISTESYKGVRDFYPADQAVQNYIFGVMKKVSESWGYVEYNSSVLEPLSLYKSKSSEEIVSEQIYSFQDRGGRDVALRPEMTPTVARMIAGKIQELPSPIRWYSIPNLFRYEKPQRGRLREHWQLNVDIFGVSDFMAEVEIISVAHDIMKKFGAGDGDFQIRISSRALLDEVFKKINIEEDKRQFVYRLLDKKEKMPDGDFRHSLVVLVGEKSAGELLEDLYFGEGLLTMMGESQTVKRLNQIIQTLRKNGISNLVFTPTLVRGFDYYTGTVFEVFDTDKENPRSLFGGGRYDNLVSAFTSQSMPGVGFGMGDVTIQNFLETHKILPKINASTKLYICVAPETSVGEVYKIARILREKDVNVAVDISGKKLGDQLKSLDKRNIPYVSTIGPEELKSQNFTIRNTETREEKSGSIDEIVKIINASR
ncbi:MAG: histidine--tRNA ligase [Candidatus Zambryskibacteria bacterium]